MDEWPQRPERNSKTARTGNGETTVKLLPSLRQARSKSLCRMHIGALDFNDLDLEPIEVEPTCLTPPFRTSRTAKANVTLLTSLLLDDDNSQDERTCEACRFVMRCTSGNNRSMRLGVCGVQVNVTLAFVSDGDHSRS
jgi:hypothetical protein